nr:MAG TPA: hypothetical protein [Caudoviricetes sp.]DAH71604.1 MAG TPA: hypothetical protein [Caudoviricetes sp.]
MFAFLRRVSHHLSSCQTTRGPYIRYFLSIYLISIYRYKSQII